MILSRLLPFANDGSQVEKCFYWEILTLSRPIALVLVVHVVSISYCIFFVRYKSYRENEIKRERAKECKGEWDGERGKKKKDRCVGESIKRVTFVLLEQAEVTPWISSKHNMGMAFNRVTWNKLRKCAAQFCSYDDYNWDWSLQYIAQTCLPPSRGAGIAPRAESGLITMTMRAPRVFHIGEW